jgi:hypothetical protein
MLCATVLFAMLSQETLPLGYLTVEDCSNVELLE